MLNIISFNVKVNKNQNFYFSIILLRTYATRLSVLESLKFFISFKLPDN